MALVAQQEKQALLVRSRYEVAEEEFKGVRLELEQEVCLLLTFFTLSTYITPINLFLTYIIKHMLIK